MSSYVKRRNCCLLKKSKKYFESIRQNTNEMLDVINEFTIKGEFCEFKDGDLTRLFGMRCAIGDVIEGWAEHTKSKLAGEIDSLPYYEVNLADTLDTNFAEFSVDTEYTAVDANDSSKTYKIKCISNDTNSNAVFQIISADYSDYKKTDSWPANIEFTEDSNDDSTPDSGVAGLSATQCNYSINFYACLHMTGSKLQAEPVKMYELKDVINAPFVTGDQDAFKAEYESNPDILIEDISEFLQAIDKLESLMKNLSIDNNQRDPDTEFCCKGNPPPGGKQSC